MTVTFWKPIQPEREHHIEPRHVKRLGSGVYQLWARCDLCGFSAPTTEFTCIFRSGETAALCDNCYDDPQVTRQLVGDGWTDIAP